MQTEPQNPLPAEQVEAVQSEAKSAGNPEQKKKVLLLAGAVILLLAGVYFVMFGLNSSEGDTSSGGTGTQQTSTPAPEQPDSSATPVANPEPTPTPTPTMAATPSVTGTAGNAAALAAMAPPEPQYVDPFTGWTRIVDPPRNKKGGDKGKVVVDTSIPLIEMPGIRSSAGPNESEGANPTTAPGNNDGGFFGAVPNPMAGTNLGRNAGWISVDSRGKVTAYFEGTDGKVTALEVGAMVNGMRVRAISKEYLILIDEQTGREERVKLSGTQRFSNATGSATISGIAQ